MSHRVPIDHQELAKQSAAARPITQGFDLVADHVILTDANANVLYANPAALEKTGFSLDEVIGRNPGDLWGGQMPKSVYENMWRTIKTDKKAWVGVVNNRRKDGTSYRQQLWVNPILDEQGEVIYFAGIEPDIIEGPRDKSKAHYLMEIDSLKGFLAGRDQKITQLEQAITKLKAELKERSG